MKRKVAFFLPTRLGSLRVKNKNTKPFADIAGGLVELKLMQLKECANIDEILFSSNDPECLSIATFYSKKNSKIKIDKRPDELCLDTTNLQDLIAYVPTITNAEHIVWGHVTTPLVNGNDYDEAVEKYFSSLQDGYDSLIGVQEFKNFLLNEKGDVVNNNTPLKWPRTQDLKVLYEINHSMFISSRKVYSNKNRVGNYPYLHNMDKIKSVDIDWEDDFVIAEYMYKHLNSK